MAIAVDGLGQAYVTGLTGSADFPVTAGAFDPTYNGGTRDCCGHDAFLAKLDAAGANLLYATSTTSPGSGPRRSGGDRESPERTPSDRA